MGFKSKIAGFFAVAVLTLSVGNGVVAQVPGQAELLPNQCSAGPAFNYGSADFGDWKYNGSSGYILQGTMGIDNKHNIIVNVATVAEPGKKCTVGIDVTTPLSNGTHVIPNGHFSAGGPSETTIPASFQQGLGVTSYGLKLDSVPNAISTGVYNGQITVTVSAGS